MAMASRCRAKAKTKAVCRDPGTRTDPLQSRGDQGIYESIGEDCVGIWHGNPLCFFATEDTEGTEKKPSND